MKYSSRRTFEGVTMFLNYIKSDIMDKEKVMFTVSQLKLKTAQHVLELAGIPSFPLDQMDSAHAGIFGEIKLFVDKDHAEKAREILKQEEVL